MNFRMPDYEEIHVAFEKGEAAVVELFNAVGRQIEELAVQLEKQNEALKELQARLQKDSRNSSKPPSNDGYGKANRKESLRKSGQKQNGGQPGHKGYTLQASDKSDRLQTYTPEQCEHCQASLKPKVMKSVRCSIFQPYGLK